MSIIVMVLFQLTHPTRVDSLVLVNATSTKPGWVEWGYQKVGLIGKKVLGLK